VSELADRLRRGERLRWLFVKMPCPAEIELAGATGFDAVIIDTEHGSAEGLEHHLRAADAAGIAALVRVPNADAPPILRALDGGAAGIVVAHVLDGSGARRALDAAHYPPRGHRGLALTTRAGRHGTAGLEAHLARRPLVIAQIEDAEAVERTREIVAIDGVDAILIGSADLSISLGHPGAAAHPVVAAAIAEIEQAARAHGVPVATVLARPHEAHERGNPIAVFVATLLVRDAFGTAAGRPAGRRVNGRPTLVLLPGMLGTAALWDEVAPALSGTADLRFGRIDFDDTVEEMAATVLAVAPARFAVAGHSLGAIVALVIARLAPERVARLALLNASARSATEEQLAAWNALEQRIHAQDFDGLVRDFARANLPAHRPELAERVEAMARGVGRRGALRQLAAQRSRPDHRGALPGIAVPTVIISGALDPVCPPARQEELAAGLPVARLERLENTGHMSPLEQPDRVAAILAGWLGD
jgi:4-hydroxy-2-oxoheptanedioate aldolase